MDRKKNELWIIQDEIEQYQCGKIHQIEKINKIVRKRLQLNKKIKQYHKLQSIFNLYYTDIRQAQNRECLLTTLFILLLFRKLFKLCNKPIKKTIQLQTVYQDRIFGVFHIQ